MNEVVRRVEAVQKDPADRIRKRWGSLLSETLAIKDMNRKAFQKKLEDEGLHVSLQAISLWVRGEAGPRPHHQAIIARALEVPVYSIFPIEVAA